MFKIETDTHTHSHSHTHTHKHTCVLTLSYTQTHKHTHIHKQGAALHILDFGISSAGALELHFFGPSAQLHETNFVNRCDAWRGHLIRQHKMCRKNLNKRSLLRE